MVFPEKIHRMPVEQTEIDAVVRAIRTSAKYRFIDEGLVRRIAAYEMNRRKHAPEAVKAVKSTLHQVAGAYFATRIRYVDWEEELLKAPDRAGVQQVCLRLLERHTSMRERLNGLEEMYAWIFGQTGPVECLLDIGCGLHPLAIGWMPVTPAVRYEAYDVYTDLAAFLNRFFKIVRQNGCAYTCDVAEHTPVARADLALIFKLLPLLSHLPDAAPLRLLQNLKVRWLAVSFPVASIGGKGKGMVDHYSTRFLSLISDQPWQVAHRLFPAELVFLIDKGCIAEPIASWRN